MRRFYLLMICCLCAIAAQGQPRAQLDYRVGATFGLSNLLTSDTPYYSFNPAYGITLGKRLGDRFAVDFSLLFRKSNSDSTATGKLFFFADDKHAPLVFKSTSIGIDFDYLFMHRSAVRPHLGAGLGYLIWSFEDPVGDTVVQRTGENGNQIDYRAAELYLSGRVGVELQPASRVMLRLSGAYDYLTGVGTEFADAVNDNRPRSSIQLEATLFFLFGAARKTLPRLSWQSDEAWSEIEEPPRRGRQEYDTDGDGIRDDRDKCPDTPLGAEVDRQGCPRDMDGDGVFNGLDDCPDTPREAAGFVDMFGCAVDDDEDGVPDYRDNCRTGPRGAVVDKTGCPLDSDGDGVFDGLDDCPETAEGIEVDVRGCIDVSFLDESMVVHVDYPPGSFEVDVRSRRRLQPLIAKLKVLSDVHVTIYGYTDNVGPAEANQILSQKRANRMRDWLVSEGIDASRLEAVGRGETHFIASNQTAEGRAENRRLELAFSR
jgi:OOP family OmpA-OmpF porin